MNQLIEAILSDASLGLTATDRVVVFHLAKFPEGQRVEDIARSTGSKYRWIENEAHKLTQLGVLSRVGSNTYAINPDFVVRP